jgi:hypothetical protein
MVADHGFVVLSGVALIHAGRRWSGYGGVTAGVVGLIAALRYATAAVLSIAALDNYVLPLWLIALGVILLRHPSTTNHHRVHS